MSSRQKPNPYVIYHAECMDGLAAAYAAYKVFGPNARYVEAFHQTSQQELREGADIYFVDFAYPRDVLVALSKKHPKIVILDHHKSTAADLNGIQEEAPNIEYVFDMNRSGATIAWEYFITHGRAGDSQRGTEAPPLYAFIEDRDLWRKELKFSDEVAMAVQSYPRDFFTFRKLLATPLTELIAEGTILLRQRTKDVQDIAKVPRGAYVGGKLIPVVNAPYTVASETGNYLLRQYPTAPFAATYRDIGNGDRYWSLRSDDTRDDVSEIAKSYGGGGHRNAAGFKQKVWQTQAIGFTFATDYESAIKEIAHLAILAERKAA